MIKMSQLIKDFKEQYELLDDYKNIDMKGNSLMFNEEDDNHMYQLMKNTYVQPLLNKHSEARFQFFNQIQGVVYANFNNDVKIDLNNITTSQEIIDEYENKPVH